MLSKNPALPPTPSQNSAIKELYKLLMNFIAFELKDPVTKQYLENYAKNATCDSLET